MILITANLGSVTWHCNKLTIVAMQAGIASYTYLFQPLEQ